MKVTTKAIFRLLPAAVLPFLAIPAAHALESITTLQASEGQMVRILVNQGDAWATDFSFGQGKLKATPQVAVWVEETDGRHAGTLMVTRKFAKQSWGGTWEGLREDATFRMSALPVWAHRWRASGNQTPTRVKPLPDAITGASPTGSFELSTRVHGAPREVSVLVEVNDAFDETAVWPNRGGDPGAEYNGQPAVVWQGKVDLARPGRYPLSLVGRGSHTGSDGELRTDLGKLPTAVKIVSSVEVVVP